MNYIDIKRTNNRYYCRTRLMKKWKRISLDIFREYMVGYFGLTYLGKQRIITIHSEPRCDIFRIEKVVPNV